MLHFIKTSWYGWKVYKYKKAIKAMTEARGKIKTKQAKFTERLEHYEGKVKSQLGG
tara:strand:+ start:448 stop:615 length:168 start_codon:yes stop_codon:yes gene_type:complete